MELIRGLHNLRPRHRGCEATIGAYDGMHRGHQAVLQRLLEQGRQMGLPTVVVLFEPLPREFFAPLQAPARLMSFRQKFISLREIGVDRVLRVRFDAALADMGADEFVRRVFVDGLGVRHIAVGDDLHFGKNRAGDFDFLQDIGARLGFAVAATESVTVAGERVSSTRIRQALEAADFATVAELLGRPYSIVGRVAMGQRLGTQLGLPTANVNLRRLRAPLAGVYAVEVSGAGPQKRFGVANVGTRPTIGDLTKAILEVHILDFDGDLYHRSIGVTFRSRLRDERKFASLDELKEQIHRDIAAGRDYFGLRR
jgi:riboflavin kinase/FMN adenylyltransferase